MLQEAHEHLCLRQPGLVSQVCPFAVPSDENFPTADRLVYWTLSGTALSHFVQRYSCHLPWCLSKANTAVPLLGMARRWQASRWRSHSAPHIAAQTSTPLQVDECLSQLTRILGLPEGLKPEGVSRNCFCKAPQQEFDDIVLPVKR